MPKKQAPAVKNRNGTPKQVYLRDEEWALIEKAAGKYDRGNMTALIVRGAVVEAKRILKESEGSE